LPAFRHHVREHAERQRQPFPLHIIVLIDAAEVFMNEGAIEFDALKKRLVQMASVPDSPTTASTQPALALANNLLGILVRQSNSVAAQARRIRSAF